jgi:hypothetical protein
MKKIILNIIILCLSFNAHSQWQWAKQIGGLNDDGLNTKCDASNIYVSGRFVFNCNIDATLLVSNGYNDMFLAKYDLSGNNRIWLKQFGGNNNSPDVEGGFVGLITNNAIYFNGTFYGTLTIDGITVTSSGNSDAFLAKFDLNGTCSWIKRAGGLGDETSLGLATDASGDIYWSINASASGALGAFGINKGQLFAKVDVAGNIISVKNNLVNDGYCTGFKIYNNELYISGTTQNDTTIIGIDTLFSNNVSDGFLAKTDLGGNVIWAKRFGGTTTFDHATDFEFDSNSNIYVVGQYGDSINIDGNYLVNTGLSDMYIAKFDNNGINQWIRGCQSSGAGGAYAASIAKDGEGNFYIIGKFEGTAQFGTFNVSTTNTNDMFLARYDENGDCIGVRHFGKAIGSTVEVDNNNDVLVCGTFENTVAIGSNTFTSYGFKDGFIAKTDAITGIGGDHRVAQNQLVIYANPNKGTFNIKVPDEIKTYKNAWLYVYDNTGKETARFSLDNESEHPYFDVANSGKGLYTIKLVQGNKSYSGQMVIE